MKVAILQSAGITLDLRLCDGLERVELSELEFLAAAGHQARLFAAKVVGGLPGVYRIPDVSWRNRFLKFLYYFIFHLRADGDDVYHAH